MDAYHILVVILGSTLAVFLVLGIVFLAYAIAIIKKVKLAAESAKHAVENVEAMTGSMKNVADGTVLSVFASKMWDKFSKTKSKKGSRQ